MKPKLEIITQYAKVSHIQNREDLTFISDPQEVDNIKHYLGLDDIFADLDSYNSFFVSVKDGEYILILGMSGTIPYMDKSLDKIELILL